MALLFSLLILGQAYCLRRICGTWLCPASLFGLFWFGFTFIPLAVLWWIPVNPYAIGFILLCSLALSSSALLFDWPSARKRLDIYNIALMQRTFYLIVGMSLVCLLLDWLKQGFSLKDLFLNLPESAFAYSTLVYAEESTVNVFGQFGLVFTYLSAIVGGLFFNGRIRTAVLALVPALFISATQTSKGTFFVCLAFFCAGILAHRLTIGDTQLFKSHFVRRAVLVVAVITPLTMLAFLYRHPAEDTKEAIPILASNSASYCCGHIYAFSDWFSATTGLRHSDITYAAEHEPIGFYTFVFGTKPLGVFDEVYTYGEFLNSNIYTIFRGLIMDFGFLGSLVFMFVLGLFFHWNFRRLLLAEVPVFTVAVFVFMVASFYYSFIVSAFSIKRFYVAFLLLWLVLGISRQRPCISKCR